jgi:hypothetical protein
LLPVPVSFRLFGLLPTLTDRHEAIVVDCDQACSNGVSPKKKLILQICPCTLVSEQNIDSYGLLNPNPGMNPKETKKLTQVSEERGTFCPKKC